MIKELGGLLKRPKLWQRSADCFWDDEHISKFLLEAHLNPDIDAASRRHSFIEASVNWLSKIIPAGGAILDLGCGPGLYAQKLSQAGYEVTGIDFSKRSIAYAIERDKQSKYICQNYLEIDYAERLDAVILIYCDYAALTLDERKTLLSKVYRALKPEGLFIFDVFSEKTHSGKEFRHWEFYDAGGFWSAKPHLCLEGEYYYENNAVRANKIVVVTDDGAREYIIWDTAYAKEIT
ncbi:MAG TPA: class I SAM-dependent methyltransferase [Clostridia bacterium]